MRAYLPKLDKEDNNTDNGQKKAAIGQPQSPFGRRAGADLFGTAIHPSIRHEATNLLPDQSADQHGYVLETHLLGVEMERRAEELRDLNGDHYTAKQEDHGISSRGNHDAEASGVS